MYSFLIRCGAFFYSLWSSQDQKAKDFFRLRKNQSIPQRKSPNEKILWMHCASVGEYEQGFPIIEYIRMIRPEMRIIVSFFSASAQEVKIDSQVVNDLFYLPIDTRKHAEQVVERIKPDIVIWVKYEFWKNVLSVISENKIPLFLVSAHFTQNNFYLRWPFSIFYKKIFSRFTKIFVQDREDLTQLQMDQVILAGDTRYNKVVRNKEYSWNDPAIEKFCSDTEVIVAGSTWKEDERIFSDILNSNKKLIWVPHEVKDAQSFFTNVEKKCFYSQGVDEHARLLIVDRIGILKYIYRYADFAYVGGGFGKGIHNILEPLVYGVPTIIGPNHERFLEAKEWKAQGIVQVVDGNRGISDCLSHWHKNPIDRAEVIDKVSAKAVDLREMAVRMGLS